MAGLVTGKKRLAVYRRFDFTCAHCGRQFPPPEGYDGRFVLVDRNYVDHRGRPKVCLLVVDHIYPRHLGGTSDPDNLQALCTQCNSRKGIKI
jgi:5-methylcytosine-specific restriction endonuclease McrA